MIKKSFLFLSFLIAFSVLLSGCAAKKDRTIVAEDDSPIILFYGEECPHCKNVEKYLDENKVAEKIQFSEREVYHDEANAALMAEKAKQCGYDENNLGVPFLWTEEKCFMGDVDIIQYFKEKTEQQ